MAQPDPAEIQRQQEIRRRAIGRKRAREHFRPMTPEALQGRKHIDVQTGQTLLRSTSELLRLLYIKLNMHVSNVRLETKVSL